MLSNGSEDVTTFTGNPSRKRAAVRKKKYVGFVRCKIGGIRDGGENATEYHFEEGKWCAAKTTCCVSILIKYEMIFDKNHLVPGAAL